MRSAARRKRPKKTRERPRRRGQAGRAAPPRQQGEAAREENEEQKEGDLGRLERDIGPRVEPERQEDDRQQAGQADQVRAEEVGVYG